MPLTHLVATRLGKKLTDVRKSGGELHPRFNISSGDQWVFLSSKSNNRARKGRMRQWCGAIGFLHHHIREDDRHEHLRHIWALQDHLRATLFMKHFAECIVLQIFRGTTAGPYSCLSALPARVLCRSNDHTEHWEASAAKQRCRLVCHDAAKGKSKK